MSRLGPLERLGALPTDVVAAIRMIPDITENTRRIAEHTAVLSQVLRQVEVLETMDARMAAIEEAMPVLVEVQRHLAQLPETMGRLDEGLARLSVLMEKMVATIDGLNESVKALESSIEPLGRLASRVPGQRKDERA
jgi:hypothetical protein